MWSGWPVTPEKAVVVHCPNQAPKCAHVLILYWYYLTNHYWTMRTHSTFLFLRERVYKIEHDVYSGFLLTSQEAVLMDKIKMLERYLI
jgi:hypothetical protein